MLVDSVGRGHGASYLQMIHHLVSQEDGGSCFRASASVMLNALSMHGVSAPNITGTFWPTPKPTYWTQDNVVASSCASSNCSYPHCIGASLDEATKALRCIDGVQVQTLHARDPKLASADDLRAMLLATLSMEGVHLITNFLGAPMGLVHSGHYSPCVAYHPETDTALVLDVSRYKYSPWWVPVATLWKGIDTLDSDGSYRGLMVVTGTA
jgi:hypothetical protein